MLKQSGGFSGNGLYLSASKGIHVLEKQLKRKSVTICYQEFLGT